MENTQYMTIGNFDLNFFKKLLPKLQSEGVRFYVEANDSAIKNMDAVTASYGGLSGNTANLFLHIHENDFTKYDRVYNELFDGVPFEQPPT